MKKCLALLTLSCLFCPSKIILAQCNSGITPNGSKCGAIQTAVPFLLINPDARSAGMGDAGIAISTDANAMHFNASKLAMSDQEWGGAINYTPWLRGLGVNDVYLANGSGFYRFGKDVKQTIGFSLTYFSLGDLVWTDVNSAVTGYGSPREFSTAVSYSRQLSNELSVGLTGKYIYSNLASGQSIGAGPSIRSGQSGAADISFTYKKPIKTATGKGDLTIGIVASNLGSKITYLTQAEFLPTNLGIGVAYNKPFDNYNRIIFTVDFNKLLVPTPYSINDDPTQEWRKANPVSGIFNSLTKAPGGFKEKIQEINISAGAEYWYDNQFALRAGFFYEDKSKGGRQFLTVGLGLKYSVMGINISYLVPTSSQRTALDNTLRFSLLFDANTFKIKDTQPNN